MRLRYIVIALAVLSTVPCFGQQTQQIKTISGKDHPELIDDATAYWHLLHILTRSGPEDDDMFNRRRLAIASKTGLKPDQIALLLSAADKFSGQLSAFNAQPATAENIAQLRQSLLGIVKVLQDSLGPYAWSILSYHVNTTIKPGITVFQR